MPVEKVVAMSLKEAEKLPASMAPNIKLETARPQDDEDMDTKSVDSASCVESRGGEDLSSEVADDAMEKVKGTVL